MAIVSSIFAFRQVQPNGQTLVSEDHFDGVQHWYVNYTAGVEVDVDAMLAAHAVTLANDLAQAEFEQVTG